MSQLVQSKSIFQEHFETDLFLIEKSLGSDLIIRSYRVFCRVLLSSGYEVQEFQFSRERSIITDQRSFYKAKLVCQDFLRSNPYRGGALSSNRLKIVLIAERPFQDPRVQLIPQAKGMDDLSREVVQLFEKIKKSNIGSSISLLSLRFDLLCWNRHQRVYSRFSHQRRVV